MGSRYHPDPSYQLPEWVQRIVSKPLKYTCCEEKEETMAKTKLKFDLTDGLTPTNEGGTLLLKSPLPLNLRPGHELRLDLGLSCDKVLVTFAPSFLKKRGLQVTGPGIAEPGNSIVVTVKNTTDDVVFVDAGDTVLCAGALTADVEVL